MTYPIDKEPPPKEQPRSIKDIWQWTDSTGGEETAGEELNPAIPNASIHRNSEHLVPDEFSPQNVIQVEGESGEETEYPADDNFDFWEGYNPEETNGFLPTGNKPSVGITQPALDQLKTTEPESPPVEVKPAAATPVEKPAPKKSTRRAEDYQTPKIPWLSQKKRGAKVWGYGFIIAILITIFGSITIGTYLVLLNSKVSIPTIVVNVSIISLLLFLFILVARYISLIYMSFLHLSRSKEEEFDPNAPQLKASILIPAYNEGKGIEDSILSMLELDYQNFEVIVINDGSKDDTLEVARKHEGWHGNILVKVISQRNMGKSNALNYGASVATGDVIICVDGDSKLHPQTLKLGMRHFADPKLASVAGNVKVINRRNMMTNLQALEYIEGLNLVRRAQALMQAVNIVPGPCGFFRKSVILEVGGWDDDTFAEDCDLTLKVLTKGYKIDYEPGAISYTEAPEKLLQLLKQRYRWTRGILQALRKNATHLINPLVGWRVVLVMWQMVFESVLWPLMNVAANLLFLLVALIFEMSPLIVFWWVQLTILDTIAAMHTVAIERESIKLVPFAIIYRAFFIQLVDVAKLLATFEELIGIEMSWGHMERQGRLGGPAPQSNTVIRRKTADISER